MRAYYYDNVEVSQTPPAITQSTTANVAPSVQRHRGRAAAAADGVAIPTPSKATASIGDQRLPHDSGRDLAAADLEKLGVLYYRLPDVSGVDELASQRGYRNRDEITVSPEKMGAVYEDKVKSFFHEHLHEDEEIRYIRDGRGYFDVRSKGDDWVRIQLEKDDLIILPAGIYHRFTTDADNYIQAMRLFKDEPKWTPLNRAPELDSNEHRQGYVSQFLK
ncbi:hypothetical protein JX266_009114 [Neoarthrinium moseri]|nr:hypothetical protein JX266_009114 [Neoarthrinium moseri]